MIYVIAYTAHMNQNTHAIALNNSSDFKDLSYYWKTEEAFNALISSVNLRYRYGSGYTTSTNIRFQDIEKEVNDTSTYQERLDAINSGENEINKEESKLQLEESLIRSFSISQLIMKFSLYKEECYRNIGWECNLNSVWFLFLLNHNKYNFFFLDLQMLLKVVFGCVQGRRRMSRLYTLAHIRELPFLCV